MEEPHILLPYGGADGELGASIRYLSQKFSMVTPEAKATLNDIISNKNSLIPSLLLPIHSPENKFLADCRLLFP